MINQFQTLLDLMNRLRGPNGCPWDQVQSHRTLRHHTIEEAYELCEAIEAGFPEAISDELGDLLFHVVFYARIAEEAGTFDIHTVIEGITRKLVRRHPHVFENANADDAETVARRWEEIKRDERAEQGKAHKSQLDGVSGALPALVRARKLCDRAAMVGFEWPKVDGALEKLNEELEELRHEIAAGPIPGTSASAVTEGESLRQRREQELGDVLFVLVNVARFLQVDPEVALSGACGRFDARFRGIESRLQAEGSSPEEASLEEMDRHWNAVKRSIRDEERERSDPSSPPTDP